MNNVHFDKGIGIAEITPAAAKDFCKRHFPDDYNHFEKYMKNHPETLLLDFENILSSIEKSPAYETLYNTIEKQRIDTHEELAFLSGFIIFQRIRSHAIFRSMLEFADIMEIERFEYFWLLKNLLGNPDYLYQLSSIPASAARSKGHRPGQAPHRITFFYVQIYTLSFIRFVHLDNLEGFLIETFHHYSLYF